MMTQLAPAASALSLQPASECRCWHYRTGSPRAKMRCCEDATSIAAAAAAAAAAASAGYGSSSESRITTNRCRQLFLFISRTPCTLLPHHQTLFSQFSFFFSYPLTPATPMYIFKIFKRNNKRGKEKRRDCDPPTTSRYNKTWTGVVRGSCPFS